MKRKAQQAMRDPSFWLGLAVAGFGAIELGLKTMEAQLPPFAFGIGVPGLLLLALRALGGPR